MIGPGLPSPTSQLPVLDLTAPTGATTAAVPQAKVSTIDPEAQSARHCSTDTRPSSTTMPSSSARVEQRVAGDARQERAGQGGGDDAAAVGRAWTKNRFMPPISSTQRRSAASSHTTWSQPCAVAWALAAKAPP